MIIIIIYIKFNFDSLLMSFRNICRVRNTMADVQTYGHVA